MRSRSHAHATPRSASSSDVAGDSTYSGHPRRASCVVRRAWRGEFGERQRPPAVAREGAHLSGKDRAAHPSHAELERAADAVIAEDGRVGQCGHIHVNTAQVTSAKITPSNVALSVMAHARRYQMDICHSASV